jgi:tetratricopeptide (TPR) repeat protein
MTRLHIVGGTLAFGFGAGLVGTLLTDRPQAAAADPEVEARVLMETIEWHERHLDVDPGNPVVGAALIGDHMSAFQLDNDLAHLERAVALSEELVPTALDRSAAYARVASARLSLHDFRPALHAARSAVAADSSSEGALGTLFDAATASGEYDEAEWALRALRREHPSAFATQLRYARWLEASGEPDAAVALLGPACDRLRSGVVRRQFVAWCETILGGLEGSAGNPESETWWYQQALETQPDYLLAIEGLATVAYRRSEWARAAELYGRILTDAHPDLYLRLAEVTRAMGDEEAARGHEERFLKIASTPRARALHAHELALLLSSRRDRSDEALEVIIRDVAERRSVEALEVLAWVHLTRGEFVEALGASTEARSWGQPDQTSDYTLARILSRLGREGEAGPLLERALADPSALAPHARWHAAAGA